MLVRLGHRHCEGSWVLQVKTPQLPLVIEEFFKHCPDMAEAGLDKKLFYLIDADDEILVIK